MRSLNADGPRRIREVGGRVFVEKKRFAGVASIFPSLSSAATQKTCSRISFTGSTRRRSVVSLAVVVCHLERSFSRVSSSTA
jgi:hypothetical protein